jgi:hypothetical protein
VAPELGAKILSLKNLETGREWMWRPAGSFRLFRNRLGDSFEHSTLVGADERLPTITPCKWEGRELPDHGEVWSIPWTVDRHVWDKGHIKTTVATPVSPFLFERTVRLDENEVRLEYALKNISRRPEPFLWAFHPLLELVEGDWFALPEDTRSVPGPQLGLDGFRPLWSCLRQVVRRITERGHRQLAYWRKSRSQNGCAAKPCARYLDHPRRVAWLRARSPRTDQRRFRLSSRGGHQGDLSSYPASRRGKSVDD